jgi:hypothetical protein
MKIKVIFPKQRSGLPQNLPVEIEYQTEFAPRVGERFAWPADGGDWVFDIAAVFYRPTLQNTLALEIELGSLNPK